MFVARGVAKECNHLCRPTKTERKHVHMPLDEAQLKGIFMRFDTNKDGRLSMQELKAAFNSLGAVFPAWRAYWALHDADRNGDGYINPDELAELVKYAIQFGYTVN